MGGHLTEENIINYISLDSSGNCINTLYNVKSIIHNSIVVNTYFNMDPLTVTHANTNSTYTWVMNTSDNSVIHDDFLTQIELTT
jgi:hypothetical protein